MLSYCIDATLQSRALINILHYMYYCTRHGTDEISKPFHVIRVCLL